MVSVNFEPNCLVLLRIVVRHLWQRPFFHNVVRKKI
jgi:hypothetical protein